MSAVSGHPVSSDGELIQRAADGDRSAFEQPCASVWRSAGSYKPERGPGAPWLYAVARNAIVDRARSRSEIPAEIPDEPATGPGPADQAEQSWVAWRVHRALEELPEREREVIQLAYWSGLSQSEVAEFLGLPLGTVKTRTRAALMRLSDILGNELT